APARATVPVGAVGRFSPASGSSAHWLLHSDRRVLRRVRGDSHVRPLPFQSEATLLTDYNQSVTESNVVVWLHLYLPKGGLVWRRLMQQNRRRYAHGSTTRGSTRTG